MTSAFTTRLEVMEGGYPFMNVMFIPDDVVRYLGLKANTRLLGTINGVKFRLASLSNGAGQFYITINKALQKSAGIKPGQEGRLEISVDPNPDQLDIPEEFEALLEQDPEVIAKYEKLTIGYRRSVLHY